jgi:hypothetical protein
MQIKKIVLAFFLMAMVGSLTAQEQALKVKVTDTREVATVIRNVSSSSSSSCNTSDFPVYQGSERTDVDFRNLKKIIVRHDKPAEDPNNYLTVELVSQNGESGTYEMIKGIRITGVSEKGDFSVKVIDVLTVEVL